MALSGHLGAAVASATIRPAPRCPTRRRGSPT